MTQKKERPSPPSSANSPQALFARAVQRFNAGQLDQVAPLCQEVIQLQPDHANAWQLLGMAHVANDRPADALPALQRALALNPRHTQILCLIGTAHGRLGEAEQAIRHFQEALAIAPQDANIWYDLGNIQNSLDLPEAALGSYNQALARAPQHADAWLNRSHALLALNRVGEAIDSLEHAVDIRPRARTWLLLGSALEQAQRLPDALACYEKVVALDPDDVDGWLKFGSVLEQLGRPDLALERIETAQRLTPESPRVLLALASTLSKTSGDAAALAPLLKAHALAPDDLSVNMQLLHFMLKTAHWDGLTEVLARVAAQWRSGTCDANTLSMLAHPDVTASDLRQANQTYHAGLNAARWPQRSAIDSGPPATRRLRVGYLSSDLRHHAVGFLMAGVFEAHDHQRFETFAFSIYPQPDESPERRRIRAAFEHFIDIHDLGDDDAAALIAGHGIDLLVDLNGLTTFSRPGIVARRPAPVQAQYLGYPGTSGLAAVDYIIGDRWVTPTEQADAFSERIVQMPDSFQANDDQRRIASDTPSRAALGLPERGFVFCCLNNSYKILPEVFDTWMRLLQKTPGSVLWLLGDSDTARDNLRAHAQARGVPPERLVFARRRPYEQYLAQYRQADLFLDTLPFNGGTTVSDALWAGLPVLTQAGNRFAGRMAASLLDNVGLPELITHSGAEYEAMAHRLATEPGLLQGLRQRLAANTPTSPLFDTRRFTRHLERAFEHMVEHHRRGLSPQAFNVADLPAHPTPPAA